MATHVSDRRHAARDRHRLQARAPTERGLRACGTAVGVRGGGVSASDEADRSVGRVGGWVATHVSDRRHAVRDRHRREAGATIERTLRARGTAVGVRGGGASASDEALQSVGRVGSWVATHAFDCRHAVRDRDRSEYRATSERLLRACGTAVDVRGGGVSASDEAHQSVGRVGSWVATHVWDRRPGIRDVDMTIGVGSD